MPNSKPKPKVSAVRRVLRSPLLAPFNQVPAWDRLAGLVNPAWSLAEPRARVVRVVNEAPGVRSVWLKPNGRFKGFQPGQHVLIEVEVNGTRQARCFSFSAAPRADGLVRLTIKGKQGGPVSAAMHALQRGDIVRLGQAQGAFSPDDADGKLLLVAAGSGITPMLSLLHGMADAGSRRDVVLLQSARDTADLILASEIESLAARLPGLRVVHHASADTGRLDVAGIVTRVPDWQERAALLCGPDGFMAMIEALYAGANLAHRLQSESFGRRAAAIDASAPQHAVHVDAPVANFIALAGQSLLDAAEAAGLSPRFGCRRGICRTCSCLKRSGTVLNQLTGLSSGPGEEVIQLCISTPQSALELAL